MSLSNLFSVLKGGAGSGNRGHAGVPGKRGGSAPKGLMTLSPNALNLYFADKKDLEEILRTKTIKKGKGGRAAGEAIFFFPDIENQNYLAHTLPDRIYRKGVPLLFKVEKPINVKITLEEGFYKGSDIKVSSINQVDLNEALNYVKATGTRL